MPSIDFMSKSNMEKDCAVSGLKFVELQKGIKFKVSVEFDKKIFPQISEDLVLQQQMFTTCQEAYDTVCKNIQSQLKAFDKLFIHMDEKGVDKKRVDENLKGLNEALSKQSVVGAQMAEAIVKDCWTTYSKKKKEYTKYKIKIGVTIFGAAAGLITSIALMATSPFTGGLSAAVGIIGMFKSAVTVVTEIGSAWAEVETSQKMLEKQIAVVVAASKNPALRVANSVASSVFSSFLGIANPSLKTCKSALDTIEKKLIGIEVKTHEASKLLNKLLTEQTRFHDDFIKEATSKLTKQAPNKLKEQLKEIEKNLDKVLAPNYQAVDKQLQAIDVLNDRFEKAEAAMKVSKGILTQLEAAIGKKEALGMKILDNFLTLTSIPMGALSGNGIAKSATDLASGIGSAAASFAYDKISGKALGGSLLA